MRLTTVSDDLARLRGDDPGRKWSRGPDHGSLVILFTPRSGSTWLGKLLEETSVLGFPEEYLSPAAIADANSDLLAASEYDFLCGSVARRTTRNGFFSIQTTWGDIDRLESIDFFNFFNNAKFVWLRRYDIVDQAISLLVATETGQFHRRIAVTESDGNAPNRNLPSDLSPDVIDGKLIRWIAHIMRYEALTEIQLAARHIIPCRMFYEDLERSPEFYVREIEQLCGVEHKEKKPVDAILKNVRTGREKIRDAFIKNNRKAINELQKIRPGICY